MYNGGGGVHRAVRQVESVHRAAIQVGITRYAGVKLDEYLDYAHFRIRAIVKVLFFIVSSNVFIIM